MRKQEHTVGIINKEDPDTLHIEVFVHKKDLHVVTRSA